MNATTPRDVEARGEDMHGNSAAAVAAGAGSAVESVESADTSGALTRTLRQALEGAAHTKVNVNPHYFMGGVFLGALGLSFYFGRKNSRQIIAAFRNANIKNAMPEPSGDVMEDGSRLAARAFAIATTIKWGGGVAGVLLVAYLMDVRSVPEFSAKMRTILTEKTDGLKDAMQVFKVEPKRRWSRKTDVTGTGETDSAQQEEDRGAGLLQEASTGLQIDEAQKITLDNLDEIVATEQGPQQEPETVHLLDDAGMARTSP